MVLQLDWKKQEAPPFGQMGFGMSSGFRASRVLGFRVRGFRHHWGCVDVRSLNESLQYQQLPETDRQCAELPVPPN